MKYRFWIISTIVLIILGSLYFLNGAMGEPGMGAHAANPAVGAPVANFTSDPASGLPPLQVQFSDQSSGNPTGWAWYFGDEVFNQPWIRMTNAAQWQKRRSHASVALPDGSILLMGGQTHGIYAVRFNDVWRSTDMGVTWMQMTPASDWTARSSYSSVALPDGSIVLMGGYGYDDGTKYFNDVWRSTDQGATWTEMTDEAPWEGRSGFSSVALPDGSIVLMGGSRVVPTIVRFNDVWRSTDQGETWNQMTPVAEWSERSGHTSVALPDGSIVLMGGSGKSDVYRSTDKGATWERMTLGAWGGRGRNSHTSVALPDGSIIVMGGEYGPGWNFLNDVWRSTDQGATWTRITASAPWKARWGHTSVVLPDGSIVLMGGYKYPDGLFNDVWRLETAGSSEQHPAHTYNELGTYSVVLQVYNADGYSSIIKEAYITVSDTMPTPGPTPVPSVQKIFLPLLLH